MATEITYRQRVDIQRTATILAQAQAYEYVLGAEEIARYALIEDLKGDKKSGSNNNTSDSKEEDWGQKLAYPVEGGTIEGEIHDLQGRFNLNWLLTADADSRAVYEQALVRLMGKLKIPKKGSAQTAVIQLRDWLDEDSTPAYDGKEDQEYMLEEPPRRAGNRLLLDVSELNLIPGLTPEEVETLAPYVAALPINTALNLNTVSEEVLDSFDCVDAQTVISQRPKKGYDDLSKVDVFKKDQDCQKAQVKTALVTGTASEFYELSAKSVINGRTIKVRSILFRDNTQSSNIDVKVIYRRQVDPYSKV